MGFFDIIDCECGNQVCHLQSINNLCPDCIKEKLVENKKLQQRIKELEAEKKEIEQYESYKRIKELIAERDKLQQAIEEAILHLSTNYDCDGNRMDGSDAFEILQKALKGE